MAGIFTDDGEAAGTQGDDLRLTDQARFNLCLDDPDTVSDLAN
jgi:hypothetical protein